MRFSGSKGVSRSYFEVSVTLQGDSEAFQGLPGGFRALSGRLQGIPRVLKSTSSDPTGFHGRSSWSQMHFMEYQGLTGGLRYV